MPAASSVLIVALAAAATALVLLHYLQPTGTQVIRPVTSAPRIISEYGTGRRWQHAETAVAPPREAPDSEEAPAVIVPRHAEARRVAPPDHGPPHSRQLLLVGTVHWEPLPRPTHDLDMFARTLRNVLRLPSAGLRRTTAAVAVRSSNGSAGCRSGCGGRGRCDQLLGKCICRHGFQGEWCEELVPQLCNDPRPRCTARSYCHEWTRFVSRCSGQCDLESNRCLCGPRSVYPERHMFMCEWRGIEQLTPWTSPGWAHFTIAEPFHFWSAPNMTPPWFEVVRVRHSQLRTSRGLSEPLDSTRLGSTQLGSARLDSARLDSTWLDSTRLDSTRLDSTPLDLTAHASSIGGGSVEAGADLGKRPAHTSNSPRRPPSRLVSACVRACVRV